jgi:porphobilinogen synthase
VDNNDIPKDKKHIKWTMLIVLKLSKKRFGMWKKGRYGNGKTRNCLFRHRTVKNAVNVPVTVYHVSGEYAMIKAAAEEDGWIMTAL